MSTVDAAEGMTTMMDIITLAQHLGVTERFFRRLVERKRVPYYKIGKFVRFDPDEINDWLASKRIAPRHND